MEILDDIVGGAVATQGASSLGCGLILPATLSPSSERAAAAHDAGSSQPLWHSRRRQLHVADDAATASPQAAGLVVAQPIAAALAREPPTNSDTVMDGKCLLGASPIAPLAGVTR